MLLGSGMVDGFMGRPANTGAADANTTAARATAHFKAFFIVKRSFCLVYTAATTVLRHQASRFTAIRVSNENERLAELASDRICRSLHIPDLGGSQPRAAIRLAPPISTILLTLRVRTKPAAQRLNRGCQKSHAGAGFRRFVPQCRRFLRQCKHLTPNHCSPGRS
jgi:hypothetical protein